MCSGARAQTVDDGIERPDPPPADDFETDVDKDGVPDGWYNQRDARLVPGGIVGRHCLRFENLRPSREARLSRAFGVDGRKTEAIIIGVWVRVEKETRGDRLGEEPGLAIEFYGTQLRPAGHNKMGPWTESLGSRWVHVAKRIPVPPNALDAIMSVGLFGATGTMDIDGFTFDLVPVGGVATTNLLVNGDFELGDPDPFAWSVSNGARRTSRGHGSAAALEFATSGARAQNGLGVMVDRLAALEVVLMARGSGLRGGGGAASAFFFLDGDGKTLPGLEGGVPLFRWEDSFDWRPYLTVVPVPRGAVRAVMQIEKSDSRGTLWVDDVKVRANPAHDAASWTPYHVETDRGSWLPIPPSPSIAAGSALDASFLLQAPAGHKGFVTVRDERLAFGPGSRARFFGVAYLTPTAFQDSERTDALADRLARSGVNLVRLGDLDTPLGPARSLFDDTADDTNGLDPVALSRFDHLIAALRSRGIYVALELQSSRLFRTDDGVLDYRDLPPGGGPAAAFDPKIRALALKGAEQLLTHINPETGKALRDDPILAWVTLSGELSLFDLIENPRLLPLDVQDELHKLSQEHGGGSARRFWQTTESAQWKKLADDLREMKVRVPIAGCAHWRRTPPEFVTTEGAPGLDLIDDRLFWSPSPWGLPERRSIVRDLTGGMAGAAARKRHLDRPYVVGQWCAHTDGAWALPYEAADLILAAQTAAADDWDALVRRGVFLYPDAWGANATGTGGGEDLFQIPEVVNGIPQVSSLLPHAASIMLRSHAKAKRAIPSGRPLATRVPKIPGWDPKNGRLEVETPFTQVLAGWPEGLAASSEALSIDIDNQYAVVAATSMTAEPIASSRRLLVTAVARVEPTGFRWVDEWKRDVAAPGGPPLLMEPVRGRVIWKRKGTIKAYALDNTGARSGPVDLEKTAEGVKLTIGGRTPTMHWELVME
jgi:hypothetical protein